MRRIGRGTGDQGATRQASQPAISKEEHSDQCLTLEAPPALVDHEAALRGLQLLLQLVLFLPQGPNLFLSPSALRNILLSPVSLVSRHILLVELLHRDLRGVSCGASFSVWV